MFWLSGLAAGMEFQFQNLPLVHLRAIHCAFAIEVITCILLLVAVIAPTYILKKTALGRRATAAARGTPSPIVCLVFRCEQHCFIHSCGPAVCIMNCCGEWASPSFPDYKMRMAVCYGGMMLCRCRGVSSAFHLQKWHTFCLYCCLALWGMHFIWWDKMCSARCIVACNKNETVSK